MNIVANRVYTNSAVSNVFISMALVENIVESKKLRHFINTYCGNTKAKSNVLLRPMNTVGICFRYGVHVLIRISHGYLHLNATMMCSRDVVYGTTFQNCIPGHFEVHCRFLHLGLL
jgi:hypothetical protein